MPLHLSDCAIQPSKSQDARRRSRRRSDVVGQRDEEVQRRGTQGALSPNSRRATLLPRLPQHALTFPPLSSPDRLSRRKLQPINSRGGVLRSLATPGTKRSGLCPIPLTTVSILTSERPLSFRVRPNIDWISDAVALITRFMSPARVHIGPCCLHYGRRADLLCEPVFSMRELFSDIQAS